MIALTTAVVLLAVGVAADAAYAHRRAARAARDIELLSDSVMKLADAIGSLSETSTEERRRLDAVIVAANALQSDVEQHKEWATPTLLELRAKQAA